MKPPNSPPWNFLTRRPPSPRAYSRARGLRLIAYRPYRGGWQLLALVRDVGLVVVLAERQMRGEYQVRAIGPTMAHAVRLVALCLSSRRGVVVNRRLLALLHIDVSERLAKFEPDLSPPASPPDSFAE